MQLEVVGAPEATDVSIIFRGFKSLPVRIRA